MKILIFLFWEEKVHERKVSLERIRDEIGLSDKSLKKSLEVLRSHQLISLEGNEDNIEVSILNQGIIKVDQLLSA